MRRSSLLRLPGAKRNGGFALVLVIWGLGVIALLIVSFMTAARLRLQAAANISGAAQAGFVADSAINAAILQLLSEKNGGAEAGTPVAHDGRPRFCSLAGAGVAVAIEDEGGKIDLNNAEPELLQLMLKGLGVDRRAAEALSKAIGEFHSAPAGATATGETSAPQAFAPAQARFTSALELDQVPGIDMPLFRKLLPFATVHSGHSGLNTDAAPPALFAAIAGYPADTVAELMAHPFPNRLDRTDPRIPLQFKQSGQGNVFLVHAEAILPTGPANVSEAIVELGPNPNEAFAIRELRHGSARRLNELRANVQHGAATLPNCIQAAAKVDHHPAATTTR